MGIVKGILIGIGLIVLVMGAFFAVLGGGAYVVDSKLDKRANEIEAEMMAEIPDNVSDGERELFRKNVKKLARTAAEMEMAQGLNDVGQSGSASKTPSSATASASADAENHEDQSSDYDAYVPDTGDKDWEFGEPVEATEY